MGANTSALTSSDVSNMISNSIIKNNSMCMSNTQVKNNAFIGGNDISADITQVAAVTIDQECVAKQSNMTDLTTAIASQIAQTSGLSSSGSNLLSANTSTQDSDITNNVESNFDEETIQSCVSSITATNSATILGTDISAKITQTASGQTFQTCIMGTSNDNSAASNIATAANQKSSIKDSSVFSWIVSLVGMFVAGTVALIIFAVVCIAGLYYILHKRKKATSQVN